MKNTHLNIITVATLLVVFSNSAIAQTPNTMFAPLPTQADNAQNPVTAEKIKLGKKLYFETKLSNANDISCNSCHGLNSYGVDNKQFSSGHKGQLGDRNSPSVYNSALHTSQFWDGRAKDVEEQALGPIMNPVEMAMGGETDVIGRLKADPEYPALFKAAFPKDTDPITFANVGKAIGAFERTLQTPSRFDDFLKGNDKALSAQEKKGLETFKSVGCATCHFGDTVGGKMFQKLGLVKPYPTTDPGRFKVTNNEFEKYFFKVPSLRNVEKTAPYFHDGSIKTLDQAVKTMAEYQLGKTLTDEQTADIVAFLKSLTGTLPAEFVEEKK
jgi:cytochrome c peroxidase